MSSERENRREQRRMKRREKKLNSARGNPAGTLSEDSSPVRHDAAESPTFQGVDKLADMDDWASTWQQVKESGEKWGGRGKGGRGIQRNTWQPKDIYVEGVTLAYQGKDLLERTTIRLGNGRRYGVIGANGVGKTTLLRRIAAGAVPGWPLHMRSYLVQQEESAGDSRTALEVVMASDSRVTALQREADALETEADGSERGTSSAAGSSTGSGSGKKKGGKIEDALSALSVEDKQARLEEIYEELDLLDAHDADTRATNILKGLGFTTARMASPTAELSGGWMMRVSLACALFCRPDLLLLDEPTNHLDLEGVVWLSRCLTEEMGETTILMVSHDAAFLDNVATDIVHFQLKQLNYYPGNYSAFLKTKADQDLAANRTQENLDRQRKHMEESVKKMVKAASGKGGDQKKLGQVASRTKKLERHGLERDPHGHRFKAQQAHYKFGISIRAGSANEQSYRGGGTERRSLAAHVDRETVFRFPDVSPLACGADAPLIQCRNVSFSFQSASSSNRGVSTSEGVSKQGKPHGTSPLRSQGGSSAQVKGKRISSGKAGGGTAHPSASPPSASNGTTNLLEGVTLDLTLKSRIVLVGRNGSGKSTLLRLIASAAGLDQGSGGAVGASVLDGNGAAVPDSSPSREMFLEPTGGSIVRNHNARVGLFTQLHTEKLRMSESPLQHMQRLFRGMKGMDDPELRRQLGCCGITGSLALQEMRSLSGGQKSRVVLAELMARRPHILLMDEPTNHLDLASIDALKAAIQGYQGGVILASHDQALISDILDPGTEVDEDLGEGVGRGELWEVRNHRVRRREGGIEEYIDEIGRLADSKEAKRRATAGSGGGGGGRG